MDNRPIGIFDSGVGGLSILNEVREQLPGEDIIYLGDTARVPYGSRSKETVTQYAREATNFLRKQDVKAVIVACNTASALALDTLVQENEGFSVIGVVEAGAKGAANHSKTGNIGVIGTEATIRSQAYSVEVRKLLPQSVVIGIGCPLFVPIIEEGWTNSQVATITAQHYLAGFKQYEIDTLILGCTHYPALWSVIQETMGEKVRLINPAYETAKQIKQLFRDKNIQSEKTDGGTVKYCVTDAPERFKRVGGLLVRDTIEQADYVDLLK